MKLSQAVNDVNYVTLGDYFSFYRIISLSVFFALMDAFVIVIIGSYFGGVASGTGASKLDSFGFLNRLIVDIDTTSGVLIMLGILIVSLIMNIVLLRVNAFYTYSIAGDLADRLVQKYNALDSVSVALVDGADFTKNVVQETYRVGVTVVQPAVVMVSGIVGAWVLVTSLLFIHPRPVFILVAMFLLMYVFIFKLVKIKLSSAGKNISSFYNTRMRLLREITLGSSDVRELSLERYYDSKFQKASKGITQNSGEVQLFSQIPKVVIEFFLFAMMLYAGVVAASDPLVLGLLATLGLSALKLLPIAQKVYHSVAQISGNLESLREIQRSESQLDELLISRQIENRQSLSDGDFIEITGLTLQYPASKELLGPFSFSFKVTNEVVFYGESGIGKSSIFLFLQGRIKGFSGSFKINNCVVNQDELVGLFQGGMNITQKNYIFNASLVDNVTGFSRNVDSEHYSSSLELSCIEDTLIEKIGSLKLAENGSELSGGQRQRVLIARALYSDKYVYFFDEITSALDRQTALKILHNINEKKSKAIKFYISHDITLWDDPNVLKVKISKSV